MQQLYQIGFSKPAQEAYLQLDGKAQAQIKAGQNGHPIVKALSAVDNALDVTIPNNPHDPCRALAGRLKDIYMLPLGTISISYTICEGRQEVIVLLITETERNRTIRKWLSTAIENGEVDGLLEKLGVVNPCSTVEVGSRLLH
jgi:hypothetical protein